MNRFMRLVVSAFSAGFLLSACSHLQIDYEFNTGQAFTDIQGAFSNKTSVTYRGYMYYVDRWPDKASLPWDTATLHAPAAINGDNDVTQCWNQVEDNHRTLNFYCGGGATTPATPPAGTYQVNVPPKTFTFTGVTSRTIDADLSNVFVPVVQLTMGGSGKITLLTWQWWKKTGGVWAQPTNNELSAALANADFEIGRTDWVGDPATSRVRGNMNLLITGTVAPPAQAFTPGALRIHYADEAKYHYGFEWR